MRGLQPPVESRPWAAIVYEQYTVANKHFVFEFDSTTEKGMRRNLAEFSDNDTCLNFDKGANSGFVPNSATVEIHQFGLRDLNVRSQLNAARDRHVLLVLIDYLSPPCRNEFLELPQQSDCKGIRVKISHDAFVSSFRKDL